MLLSRKTDKKNIKDYYQFITKGDIENIKKHSRRLKGKKIIHINATPIGGGVAEILKSLVPLQKSLELDSNWYTIKPDKKFFNITRKIHDMAQGLEVPFTDDEKKYYLNINKMLAGALKKLSPDLIIIHDPQPLSIIDFYREVPMILRIHPDLSKPTEEIIRFFLPSINKYHATIFSMPQYIPRGLKIKGRVISPIIDPLEEKNIPLKKSVCEAAILQLGINPSKPLIAQISRFDFWKDPLGVIDAFYKAKNKIPELQLALVGLMQAQDDPAALKVFQKVKKYANGDPSIFLFSDPNKIPLANNILVNSIQCWANPILQKSKREGFGLTVTEAMWKKRVVIGGNVGGIKSQIKNGSNGFLVNNSDQAARKIVKIIKNPELAKKIGINAKETVRKKFLLPRLLKDHLKIYDELLS